MIGIVIGTLLLILGAIFVIVGLISAIVALLGSKAGCFILGFITRHILGK